MTEGESEQIPANFSDQHKNSYNGNWRHANWCFRSPNQIWQYIIENDSVTKCWYGHEEGYKEICLSCSIIQGSEYSFLRFRYENIDEILIFINRDMMMAKPWLPEYNYPEDVQKYVERCGSEKPDGIYVNTSNANNDWPLGENEHLQFDGRMSSRIDSHPFYLYLDRGILYVQSGNDQIQTESETFLFFPNSKLFLFDLDGPALLQITDKNRFIGGDEIWLTPYNDDTQRVCYKIKGDGFYFVG